MKLPIACSCTRAGAITTIVACSPTVRIREFDHSRTRKNWMEEASGPVDGIIVVQDVSNTGHHYCSAHRLTGDRITIEVPGRCICEEEMWNLLGTDVVRVERE